MSAKAGPSKRGGDAENVEKQAKRVKAAEVRALGQITATALHLCTDSYVPQPPPQEVLRRVKKLAEEAKRRGLRIMVGGAISTSLGIAPALLVAQQAEIADLDGPLRLAMDRGSGLRYDGGTIHPADPALWGGPG